MVKEELLRVCAAGELSPDFEKRWCTARVFRSRRMIDLAREPEVTWILAVVTMQKHEESLKCASRPFKLPRSGW